LLEFKTGKIAPCQLSKALVLAPKNLLSNWSQGFYLASFDKLYASSKAFGLNGRELVNSI
jgi:hypothetical protein